jgi:hypothetical protein
MKTKKLYIIICNSGDGSNHLQYTFNKDNLDKIDTDDEAYQSGDGLQVIELHVPEECTFESLGISKYSILECQDEDIDE